MKKGGWKHVWMMSWGWYLCIWNQSARQNTKILTLMSSISPHLPSFHVTRTWLLVGRNSKPNSSHGVSNLADPGVLAGVANEANLVLRPELDWTRELTPHRLGVVVDDGLKDWHCWIPVTARSIAGSAIRYFIGDAVVILRSHFLKNQQSLFHFDCENMRLSIPTDKFFAFTIDCCTWMFLRSYRRMTKRHRYLNMDHSNDLSVSPFAKIMLGQRKGYGIPPAWRCCSQL